MITILYDNIHSLRFDVLKSAFALTNTNCTKFESKWNKSFFFQNNIKIILVSHPGNYLKCLFISLIYFFLNSQIIVDFYDLQLIRKNKIKNASKLKLVEIILIYLSDCFISRSGELNNLKKQKPKWFKNKSIILIPDLNYFNINQSVNNSGFNKNNYLIVGGTSVPELKKFVKKSSKAKITMLGSPDDYKNMLQNTNNLFFKKNELLDFQSLSLMNYKNFYGIHFIDEGKNAFRRSAAIKYLTYIELGLKFFANKRHRAARFYSYYFPDKVFLFTKHSDIEILKNKMNKRIKENQMLRSKKRILLLENFIKDQLNELIAN